ncbi:MAG TPA: DNA mismatch repair protein MutS, partial [Candidatus Lokiarchaeia archaeon]|nr:DNA mismatch repair protein MutS [Candidatus Lokiarchaeia archaeon]
MVIQPYFDWAFGYDNAHGKLLELFHVATLEGFGVEGSNLGIIAAGALVQYLSEMHHNPLAKDERLLANVKRIRLIASGEVMELDAIAQKNLEILRSLRDGSSQGTLLQVIDHCKTPMGARLIRQWIVEPLLDSSQINHRLEIVGYFSANMFVREDFTNLLKNVGDLERLISRINYSTKANARHLVSLRNSLKLLPEIKIILAKEPNPLIAEKMTLLDDFSEICTLIDVAIVDSPPVTIMEGGIIAAGYNAEVDELRDILENGQNWILQYEEKEKRRLKKKTGVKVGYNNQLGYYIQISQRILQEIPELPEDYTQKSTLTSAARFVTPELKEMEEKILNAESREKELEKTIFDDVRQQVAGHTQSVQVAAEVVAELDVLANFAQVAVDHNYCRPEIVDAPILEIKDGRHPVVEVLEATEAFVPNDTFMDPATTQIMLVTGPNMSGKSTYLRQVALIVLLAQVGAFVPANSAKIGVVDRIFTRVGAADDLVRRQSTFMVEMMETAQILNNATPRSLVIIDELGRGTSTTDGLSIAHAVLECLHNIGAKTLFSTHYHQLTEINLPRLQNVHLAIKEQGKDLLFLRKLVPGGTDKSYGIHVAGLAGIPPAVIARANELLALIEQEKLYTVVSVSTAKLASQRNSDGLNEQTETGDVSAGWVKDSKQKKPVQTMLFAPKPQKSAQLIEILKSIDPNNMTPMEALQKLTELAEEAKKT